MDESTATMLLRDINDYFSGNASADDIFKGLKTQCENVLDNTLRTFNVTYSEATETNFIVYAKNRKEAAELIEAYIQDNHERIAQTLEDADVISHLNIQEYPNENPMVTKPSVTWLNC